MIDIVCARCGQQARRKSFRAKYCEACADIVRHEKSREYARTHPRAEKSITKKLPEDPPKPKPKPRAKPKDVDWRDLSQKNSRQIDAEAKAFGMSYGKYTAALRDGSINAILRERGINPIKILATLEGTT